MDPAFGAECVLGGGGPAQRVRAVVRLALSGSGSDADCPAYVDALDHALLHEPPPFGEAIYAETYREASANAQWLAISLITNAEREGDGATRLWSMAACADDAEERQLLKQHAVDESRHARLYLALFDLAFPGAAPAEFRKELDQLSPGFVMSAPLFVVEGSPYARPPTLDDFMQMNIAEIRTTIHHVFQRAALAAHVPADSWPRVNGILDSLFGDELKHVAYTARLIEEEAPSVDREALHRLFQRRLHDFNQITKRELERLVFE